MLVPRREDTWRSGDIAPPLFTSAVDGGELQALRPRPYTSGERSSDTHWVEGWVGTRDSLEAVKKMTNSCPYQESNSDMQPIVCFYIDLS